MSDAVSHIEQHVSPEKAAQKLGVHPDTIYRLCRKGKIRSSRVGRRRVIPESALLDYLQGTLAPVVELRQAK